MKSMSAVLRKLVLYGYVYDVDYSYLRNYNTELGRISSSLNQIAKRINSTGNIYQDDMNEVKELMNEVYQKVGVKKKGKATDLEKLYGFKIHPCKILLDDGSRKNGYKIIGV